MLFLAAGEVFIRTTHFGLSRSELFFTDIYDPVLRMIPGARNPYLEVAEFINGQGLRGPDFNPAKPPGVFRIVCLGDSQTFGAGRYEESYPAQLQEILDTQFPGKTQVINAGIPGTSIFQQRLLYEQVLAEMEFDALLVMSGPSCNPGLQQYRERLADPWYRGLSRAHRVLAHSALYRVLRRGLKGDTHPGLANDENWAGPCDEGDYREDLEFFLAAGAEKKFALAIIASADRRLIEKLIADGLTGEEADFISKAMPRHFDRLQPVFAAEHRLPYVVYWASFVSRTLKGEQLWHDPDHPNDAGNRLIAKAMAETAKEYQWLTRE